MTKWLWHCNPGPAVQGLLMKMENVVDGSTENSARWSMARLFETSTVVIAGWIVQEVLFWRFNWLGSACNWSTHAESPTEVYVRCGRLSKVSVSCGQQDIVPMPAFCHAYNHYLLFKRTMREQDLKRVKLGVEWASMGVGVLLATAASPKWYYLELMRLKSCSERRKDERPRTPPPQLTLRVTTTSASGARE